MCGITGIIDHNEKKTISEKTLTNMIRVLHHRGPDSPGAYVSSDLTCGLGFRRLSIIDLSEAGNQPITTDDGRYTIVFNGEIYNHREIRIELESKGYKYHSGTDTETVLYGYSEWGKDILQKMIGMWSFAIWDDKEKKIFCSRDRIGIKPFYYYDEAGLFVFSSEIKSILNHPSVSRELNLNELPNYLNFGMSGNRESLFKGIKKLPAGHYLVFDGKEIMMERYWSPFKGGYTKMNEDEIAEELIRLLRVSIKDRMMSDVPFGVFLSGGIDSSLNVALMHELMDRPVDTFTVGFKELEKYNELKYARKIADIFKTNHHEILIDQEEAFPVLEKLAWHEDEPNADPVCIPLYFLSKLTRDSGTTVVQVGEGSDEQFVGYNWMMREYKFYKSYWKTYTSMSPLLRRLGYSILNPMIEGFGQPLMSEYLRRAYHNEELYWSGVPIHSPTHMENLLSPKFKHLNKKPAKYASELHMEAIQQNKDADYLQRMLYVELQQRLAELLLMRVDKISMAHSIEARVPFLDHRIVEFSMSIPPDIKVPKDNTTKYLLKKAVKGILPDEIIHRKKQGFQAPVQEWLRFDWFPFAEDKLLNGTLSRLGLFEEEYLMRMLAGQRDGKKRANEIFSLLMLNLWYEEFIERPFRLNF
ncbi:MAG: asparagine synthase (glutamine-hydrolyzing) [Candidatus Kapaibacterium sp.]